jgi:hypothetical protein
MKRSILATGIVVATACFLGACSDDESVLAPYEGERPLTVLQITESSSPEIQWVGGRAAAVGVNVGDEAGLNASLVWIMTSSDDDISSPVRLSPDMDEDLILSLGGTPADSLDTDTDYTYWIATAEAMQSDLQVADPFNFVDTTKTLSYLVRGRSGGDPALGVTFTIVRDQTLLEDKYTVTWTPSDQPLRRLAIRNGTLGGFTDLVWHVVQPEGTPDGILPPVVIGETPPGTDEVQEWLGFEPSNHVFWGNTSDWNGESFGFRTTGYVFFQIFANNFE